MKHAKYLINKSNMETDWRVLGQLMKQLHSKVDDAIRLSGHLMPGKDYYQLEKARKAIEEFRCHAEDVMYKRGGPDDLKIFYGDLPKEESEQTMNIRDSILKEVAWHLAGQTIDGKMVLTLKEISNIECGILKR